MARILLVEDEVDLRAMVKEVLESEGHEVEEASSGTGALQSYAVTPPDLIITDLVMPGTDGIEIIMKLRKSHPNLKIIAMSGGKYLDLAGHLGATHTLLKPFTKQAVLDIVKEALGS